MISSPWVPVAERYPPLAENEYRFPCLFYIESMNKVFAGAFCSFPRWLREGRKVFFRAEDGRRYGLDVVTHWRMLPNGPHDQNAIKQAKHREKKKSQRANEGRGATSNPVPINKQIKVTCKHTGQTAKATSSNGIIDEHTETCLTCNQVIKRWRTPAKKEEPNGKETKA